MKYQEIPIRTTNSAEYAGLNVYILETPEEKIKRKKRPVVILCPGGAYKKISFREGEPLAMYYLNQGYHVGILRYSVEPARFPTALLELGMAMEMFHKYAEEWHVDEGNIFVQGSSAGGHLAACLGVFWNQSFLSERLQVSKEVLRPKGLLLSYPVISSDESIMEVRSFHALLGEKYDDEKEQLSIEKQITRDMPPCFIWHTSMDATVPVENALVLAMALRKHQIPMELHVFQNGAHGLGPATDLVERPDGSGVQKECECWMHLSDVWMKNLL